MTSGLPPSARVATLIDRYDAAWNAQDLDAIASMHDDAIVFHNHTAGERVAGVAAVREHIGAISARWRRSVSSAAACAVATTSRQVSGPRVPRIPTTVASSNGRASTSSPSRRSGASRARTVY